MRSLQILALACLFTVGCSKNGSNPGAGNANNGGGTHTNPPPQSAITVLINGTPMQVTSIQYNRSSSTFNFSAQNNLQKVDVNCFWFYQQSWANYMFSDSINYSTRADSLANWYTRRAKNWGEVYFDCCTAPLTDPEIMGNYKGNFSSGKDSLLITGNFDLLFK